MGNLTDDMTRLRGEVDALRRTRGALMHGLALGTRDLARDIAAMRADFTAAHMAMTKKTGEARSAFVAAVVNEVNTLLGDFSRDRDDMARQGRHYRGIFLTEMRRQVTGLCKETADDMMGARLAWRGQSSRKSRPVQLKPVQLKKEPVFVAPVKPSTGEPAKKTVATPEFKVEKPPVPFKEPLKIEEEKKAVVVAPEFKADKLSVTFKEPLKEEEKKGTPQTKAAESSKVKIPPSVFAAPEAPKQKEKSRLDEKHAKTATRGKRGKK